MTSYPIVQSEHKNHTDIVVPKQTKLTSTGRQVKAQDPMDVLFRIEFYRVVLGVLAPPLSLSAGYPC